MVEERFKAQGDGFSQDEQHLQPISLSADDQSSKLSA